MNSSFASDAATSNEMNQSSKPPDGDSYRLTSSLTYEVGENTASAGDETGSYHRFQSINHTNDSQTP